MRCATNRGAPRSPGRPTSAARLIHSADEVDEVLSRFGRTDVGQYLDSMSCDPPGARFRAVPRNSPGPCRDQHPHAWRHGRAVCGWTLPELHRRIEYRLACRNPTRLLVIQWRPADVESARCSVLSVGLSSVDRVPAAAYSLGSQSRWSVDRPSPPLEVLLMPRQPNQPEPAPQTPSKPAARARSPGNALSSPRRGQARHRPIDRLDRRWRSLTVV